ncbi:MAG: NADH-quinone oxidoreductase subunit C [Gammaproteobacteria bacterium]|nr:NADH-quinone oxidoreductase subunit C [Gammaproteobacteria bacterium]
MPKTSGFDAHLTRLDGPLPAWQAVVDHTAWRAGCASCRADGGHLASLWGTDARHAGKGFLVHALLAWTGRLVWLSTQAGDTALHYPDISDLFPAAARLQRAMTDLLGLACVSADTRPWLRHGAWSATDFPLRDDFMTATASEAPYPFVRVAGEGVHEIAVGPIHAGIIESGHFRFSVVGDDVLRLESRLGYLHKGVEKALGALPPAQAVRLAGRICGDSTVAYALAYAMAVEALDGYTVAPRAQALRALLLERERIANHLGDIGAICGDGGLAFGQAQFGLLKEHWLQAQQPLFGHRYLMDTITVGGVACDLGAADAAAMTAQCHELANALHELEEIISDHAGLQERFLGTGRVTAEQVEQYDGVGLIARAAGVRRDLRLEFPHAPYADLPVEDTRHPVGDVAARVALRFAEIHAALRLICRILATLPEGPLATAPGTARRTCALGGAEGWRGEVFVTLERHAAGGPHRVHVHDPSWQNWPLLELAALDGLVPDFPLINKSFNLAYSGHDL